MAKNWTEEEEEHIRQNFLTHTYGDLAEHSADIAGPSTDEPGG